MGRHLPYGITQCYLSPDTSERAPPSSQPGGRYSIYLPRRDGRLSWPRLPGNARPGTELAIFRSQVRRPTATLIEQILLNLLQQFAVLVFVLVIITLLSRPTRLPAPFVIILSPCWRRDSVSMMLWLVCVWLTVLHDHSHYRRLFFEQYWRDSVGVAAMPGRWLSVVVCLWTWMLFLPDAAEQHHSSLVLNVNSLSSLRFLAM